MEADQDHIHCLVKSEPGVSPLAIVRRLKQESTIEIWCMYERELRGHFGAMDIFAAPSEMQVRRRFASTLKVKAKVRQFIHEAEDLAVFLPRLL